MFNVYLTRPTKTSNSLSFGNAKNQNPVKIRRVLVEIRNVLELERICAVTTIFGPLENVKVKQNIYIISRAVL